MLLVLGPAKPGGTLSIKFVTFHVFEQKSPVEKVSAWPFCFGYSVFQK
jgi:hypothetical protein